MTTYQLTQRACEFDLPPEKTVEAACIHRDDDFVRFHDADHGLVYAVQRSLLLAIETVKDQDQAADAEPGPYQDSSAGDTLVGPTPTITIAVDGAQLHEAVRQEALRRGGTPIPIQRPTAALLAQLADEALANRTRLSEQRGWAWEKVAHLPQWIVDELVDHLC